MTAADQEVLSSKINNLINLNDLNENAILHNLRIRFKESIIYTNVSSILISVNPFKMLPLYTPQIMETFRSAGTVSEMPPHVYSIAAAAYDGLIDSDTHDSQSVLIR